MRARTVFIILFIPAPISVGTQEVAEAFDCEVDLNRVIPCVIRGGLVLLGVWAVAALIAFIVSWRKNALAKT
ncbi:MAG: hypothetical protein WA441_05660 [Methyloceanibacter sp.]|jgi:hypothetical protein